MLEIRLAGALSRNWMACAAAVAFLASLSPAPNTAAIDLVRDDLAAVFKEHGTDGAFVTFDSANGVTTFVSRPRAEKRFVPASTFKIANSLIALETNVVRDENEVVPFGGQPQPFKSWEKDMAMREAIAASNRADLSGDCAPRWTKGYSAWLERLGYGNRQVGDSVTTFWLDGPLEISAVEQVRFLTGLSRGDLPASKHAMGIVRDIVRLETKGDATLYGKTGWRFSFNPQLGWWVGWIERRDQIIAFALNVDLASAEDGKKRVTIGKELLQKLGVW